MPDLKDIADVLDDLVVVATKANALAAILVPLAQLIMRRRAAGADLPPTPTLDALLAAYDAQARAILATNEAWFRAHGRDPETGTRIA